jgi:hypothetical protein
MSDKTSHKTEDKIDSYRQAKTSLPEQNRLWPLYGTGLENMGLEGKPIHVPMPKIGPNELLVRHDACGLCFSDIKVIKTGQDHPRIYRNMSENPVILGHEVSLTIIGAGENLRDQYKTGDRFIIQADIFLSGVSYAYGYELQGGLSQYNVLDWRVLERRSWQLLDSRPGEYRVCRKRSHRALGMCRSCLPAGVSDISKARWNYLDHWDFRRGRQTLHHQLWFRPTITP